MLIPLFAVALATEPTADDAVALDKDELIVMDRAGGPLWPADTRGEPNCRVAVVIGTNGKVEEATASECGPGFAREATNWVRKWRYAPVERDGAPVRARSLVAVKFAADGPAEPPAAEHAVLEPRRESGPCVIHAVAHPDGTIDGLATNDPESCLIHQTASASKKVWKRLDARSTCTIKFRVREDYVSKVGVVECPDDLMKPTERLASAFTLSDGTEGRDYEMTVIYEP